jgi:pimeloyl-ACP methyl ester carboxylesterase
VLDRHVDLQGLKLHYREAGAGPAVLLLHGWPTSSFLWRHLLEPLAHENRVVAIDLPGFGSSDKPLDASYRLPFHDDVLTRFCDALGIDTVGLAVHDIGGPIGLHWAIQHPHRIRKLAVLNTLVYPELSWAASAFVLGCRLPGIRAFWSSPWGIELTLRLGVSDASQLTGEVVRSVQAPFAQPAARRALLKSVACLHRDGLREIAEHLSVLREVPVRILYGARDRILPDVATTMKRLRVDLPQAEVTVLEDCGHFLQEERPAEVARILTGFFG